MTEQKPIKKDIMRALQGLKQMIEYLEEHTDEAEAWLQSLQTQLDKAKKLRRQK